MKRGRGNGATAVADRCLAYFQSSWCCFNTVDAVSVQTRPFCLPRLSLAFGPQNCPNGPVPRTLPSSGHMAISKWLVLGPEIPVVWLQPGEGPLSTPLMCPSPLKTRDEVWHKAKGVCRAAQPGVCQLSSSHADKTQENTSEAEANTWGIHSAARSASSIRQA